MKIFKGTYYNEILNFIKEETERTEDEATSETQDEVADEATQDSEVNTETAPAEPQAAAPAAPTQPAQPAEGGEQQPAEQTPEQSPEMVEDAAKIDPAAEQEAANSSQADPTITQAWQQFADKYNKFKELYDKAGFKSWDEFIQKVNGGGEESGGEPSAA